MYGIMILLGNFQAENFSQQLKYKLKIFYKLCENDEH